jgi:hypothetical protein
VVFHFTYINLLALVSAHRRPNELEMDGALQVGNIISQYYSL